jgi:hypothetical protein
VGLNPYVNMWWVVWWPRKAGCWGNNNPSQQIHNGVLLTIPSICEYYATSTALSYPRFRKAYSTDSSPSRPTSVLLLNIRNIFESRLRDTHSTRPATQPSSRCLARSRRVRQSLCHVIPPSKPEASNDTDLLQLPIISGVCKQTIKPYE